MQEQILSRTRLQHIIETFGLYKEESGRASIEDLIVRLRKSITISPVRAMAGTGSSGLPGFNVSVVAAQPQLAQQICTEITSIFMHELRAGGLGQAIDRAIAVVGDGPTFLSVDVDVLDPAFAPGTGTPEPGGLTSAELLDACRTVARRARLVGSEVVEVLPEAIGSADVTALVADRIVRETLTGLAQRLGSAPG